MSTPGDDDLPDLAAILGPLLERVPPAQRPLLVAIAERLAAARYRSWSYELGDPHRAALLACAEREERIARRVEALHPRAEAVQSQLRRENPDLEEINRSLFADRPLRQQLALQARGERLGAATWRALARDEGDAERRRALADCAELEEQSARVLEAILGEDDGKE